MRGTAVRAGGSLIMGESIAVWLSNRNHPTAPPRYANPPCQCAGSRTSSRAASLACRLWPCRVGLLQRAVGHLFVDYFRVVSADGVEVEVSLSQSGFRGSRVNSVVLWSIGRCGVKLG